jgi:hypothetical protein
MDDEKSNGLPDPPRFGGKLGEPVPAVDPEDVETVWRIAREGEANNSKAVGFELFKHACKPGTDVQAVFYRSTLIWLVSRSVPEQLARFMREGQPNDAVFRAAAKIPAEWMAVGIVQHGPPFDVNEFLRLCGEETETV